MRLFLSCFLFFSIFHVFSQENVIAENDPKVKIDSLYREDQFYFGFTYNTLTKKPEGLSQRKLSTGFSAGFLRDMPINKNRTVAIASGVGFSYNNYNQNLAIYKSDQTAVYSIIDPETTFSKNKFSQLLVEVPLEFRWRTSTYESYKFWRIYGGFKFSYLIYDRSIYTDDQGKIVVSGNKDFNKFLYGAYISSGYNTINVYAYYGLNSLFKTAKIDGKPIDMTSLNIGIIFYIL
ncbi:porin family protein [Flavobacterium sp. ZS1P14]|uniref:porin family protein n=1 Tax=Flavobacterium sp. ZS1P14 TaxID=3401729 RepID=UPI003AACCFF5